MKFRSLFGAAMIVASSGAMATGLVGTTGIASAHPSGTRPMAYTCTGGDFQTGTFVSIPSGTYASITVKGACQPAPDAVIAVVGNVNVAAGAVLNAQSYPSTITVGHNVTAGPGSLLGLGCLPNPTATSTTGHPCVDANGNPTTSSSSITVDGNVTAWHANAVLLNGITVKRNVTLIGSEGTASVTARATAIPWAIKTNTIGGNLIVGDMRPIWLGVIVNKVGGNVILFKVHITDGLPPNNDPMPTIFVASNTVGRNLVCWGLGPYVSGGFGNEHNVVGGHAIGQCADLTDVPPSASS
jgi:hypothetical protein